MARTFEQNKKYCQQFRDKYRKEQPLRYLTSLAKRRAKSRGIEFDIKHTDLTCPETCPLLGIKLDQWSADIDVHGSLDRIDSSKGYGICRHLYKTGHSKRHY